MLLRYVRDYWFSFVALGLLTAFIVGFMLYGYNKSQTSPHIANTLSPTYGLALGYTVTNMSQQARTNELQQIKKAGFGEVRFNLDWSVIQPNNTANYHWKLFDSMLQDTKNAGLKSVITLDRTPLWARPPDCKTSMWCPPADMGTFAKFAGAAAARYKSYNIVAWEIWNEPNIVNFWKPLPNPNEYAHMLTAASAAIKRQNSAAAVLVGGLSGDSVDSNGTAFVDPRTYLAELYAARADRAFDGVAYHPYTSLKMPQVNNVYNGWYKMNTGAYNMRNIMVANGDQNKAIWLTEFGIPSDGSGGIVTNPAMQTPKGADHVSLMAQVQIAQAVIQDTQKLPWIRNLDWYTYRDSAASIASSGSSYGLLYTDGTPKPMYDILKQVLR